MCIQEYEIDQFLFELVEL